MIYYIIKGILIGILVSAPLGPSGVLCIQRTLNKGRVYGFVTGLGVAISDLLYAMITGFGMSFVTSFIESNQLLLQIAGSLVMFGFGLYLFWNNPLKSLKSSTEERKAICSSLPPASFSPFPMFSSSFFSLDSLPALLTYRRMLLL